jgi:signal peptidase
MTATWAATAPGSVAGPRHREAAPPAPAGTKSVARRIASMLTGFLLAVAALVLLLVTVGPRVFHYHTATMLTGSMYPTIKPGDVIVDTQEPVHDLAIGQIITYHIPVDDHRVESHRVIWIGHDSTGHVLIRTQGDANPIADPWTARLGTGPVWRVRTVVPLAGSIIRTLRGPAVHLILEMILPAVLVVWLLAAIWSPGESKSDDEKSPKKAEPKHRSVR